VLRIQAVGRGVDARWDIPLQARMQPSAWACYLMSYRCGEGRTRLDTVFETAALGRTRRPYRRRLYSRGSWDRLVDRNEPKTAGGALNLAVVNVARARETERPSKRGDATQANPQRPYTGNGERGSISAMM
jgi:hypothetical protein